MNYLGFDKDGRPHPTSGPWTVGAYEYGTNAPNTAPPAILAQPVAEQTRLPQALH